MPQIKRTKVIRQFYLPSTQKVTNEDGSIADTPRGDWIQVSLDIGSMRPSEIVALSDASEGRNIAGVVGMVTKRVANWNVTGEDGRPVDINTDTVGDLDMDDFIYLMRQLTESGLSKKNAAS